MKKYILLLIVPFLSFSQIEEGYYTAKYMGFAELDRDGEYTILEEDWAEVTFYFTTEYFTISFEGEEEKIWYEYLGEFEIDDCPICDIYEDEEGNELWINYELEEFWFWGGLNSRDEFEELIYFKKIEKN